MISGGIHSQMSLHFPFTEGASWGWGQHPPLPTPSAGQNPDLKSRHVQVWASTAEQHCPGPPSAPLGLPASPSLSPISGKEELSVGAAAGLASEEVPLISLAEVPPILLSLSLSGALAPRDPPLSLLGTCQPQKSLMNWLCVPPQPPSSLFSPRLVEKCEGRRERFHSLSAEA